MLVASELRRMRELTRVEGRTNLRTEGIAPASFMLKVRDSVAAGMANPGGRSGVRLGDADAPTNDAGLLVARISPLRAANRGSDLGSRE